MVAKDSPVERSAVSVSVVHDSHDSDSEAGVRVMTPFFTRVMTPRGKQFFNTIYWLYSSCIYQKVPVTL